MSTAEAALLAQIDGTVARIIAKTDDLSGNVNAGIRYLPPWVQSGVSDKWDEFVDLMGRIWDKLTEIFSNMGAPWALSALADDWSERVSGPVSGIASKADRDNTEVDRYWEGDAASAYLDTLTPQRLAIEKIQATFSAPLSTALNEMRNAIWIFWVALGTALLALVGGIIGAYFATGTIVGIPAGVAIAIGAALIFIGALAGGYLQLRSTAEGQNTILVQKLNDNTGFRTPDGGGEASWPRSTIEG
jgi:hypothetical protein